MRAFRGTNRNPAETTSAPTVLSAGTHIVGQLESQEDLVVAGGFEGSLHTERSVHLTPEAAVEGDIVAAEVLVLGQVTGTIRATRRVEIRSGAIVSGEVMAPQVRVHEGVQLNARVRMSSEPGPTRHYLLPALLKSLEEPANPQALVEAEQAAERFLASLGFDIETRPPQPDKSGTLRPIFRSRDPLGYDDLRSRLKWVEDRLLRAGQVAGEDGEKVQGTGTGSAGAGELLQALGRFRRAALMVGPVVIEREAAVAGGPRPPLRIRRAAAGLPEAAAEQAPEPAQLLLDLQRIQGEILEDLDAGERRPA